ncbi:uncharacterized protein G2W53_041813 [Senna tora]|uniref:Uncharacterized protein n=1 Tax=Senna tora TaxID=362788 RepID=A0A834VZ25_9FABA|nr:uncharacterized protein G2W53_041813 [Senna tora]
MLLTFAPWPTNGRGSGCLPQMSMTAEVTFEEVTCCRLSTKNESEHRDYDVLPTSQNSFKNGFRRASFHGFRRHFGSLIYTHLRNLSLSS